MAHGRSPSANVGATDETDEAPVRDVPGLVKVVVRKFVGVVAENHGQAIQAANK